jgi:hypothetical protein
LTFLLFLKMTVEQSKPPFDTPSPVPKGFGWSTLLKLESDDLETHYRHTLEELGKRSGMLGTICRKAQNTSRASRFGLNARKQGYPAYPPLHDFKRLLGIGLISCLYVTYG